MEPGVWISSSLSHEIIPLQEYERAVIFRLGLLLSGGARVWISSSLSHETIPLQEYERAVIFRLGLLLSGGARGLDIFFFIS